MLYFIHGSDYLKVLEKSKNLVDSMLSKKPDASLFRLNSENWSPNSLQELVQGQGLFENKYIVTMSRLLEEKEIADFAVSVLGEISESPNIFIWTEESVDKKTLAKIEKYAEKVQIFEKKTLAQKADFNIFSLGDSLLSRDKKQLWILYQEALRVFAPEEIHGTLFWQVKSAVLASKAKDADDSGLKPFVYSKSKRAGLKYSPAELDNLSSSLVRIYHEARRGKTELEVGLEKFVLGL